MAEPLRFLSFSSFVEVPFWSVLARKVLDDLKLSTDPVPISGYYGCPQPQVPDRSLVPRVEQWCDTDRSDADRRAASNRGKRLRG